MRRRPSGVEAYSARRAPPAGASSNRHPSAQSASAVRRVFDVLRFDMTGTDYRTVHLPSAKNRLRLRRLAEVIAQEDADGHGLAVALRGAEVHPPHGRDDLLVESEAGPAHDAHVGDLAVGADFD